MISIKGWTSGLAFHLRAWYFGASTGDSEESETMTITQIEAGVVVGVAYIMTVDGEETERAGREEPLEYLHGAGNIVPGLEDALDGKRIGDRFTITLSPDVGYGERDEDEIQAIAREDIEDADVLEPGMMVEIEDADGDLFDATVVEVTADAVVLDFNDELAGKTLTYEVEVVSLRPAEAQELENGYPDSLEEVFANGHEHH